MHMNERVNPASIYNHTAIIKMKEEKNETAHTSKNKTLQPSRKTSF